MKKDIIKTILFFLALCSMMYLFKQIEYRNAMEACKGKPTKNYIECITGIKQNNK
jgi:hypothetical protein